MYTRHFELHRPLFDAGIARDGRLYVGDRERSALERMDVALATRDSAVVLVGAPGTGKTTLAAAQLGRGDAGSRVTTAWISVPPLHAHELIEMLLGEFGLEAYKQSRVERLQTWRQFLVELATTDTRVFIAVEQADDVDLRVLKALAALTAADPSGCPGANLVLMGTDRLLDTLDGPQLEPLRQRVRLVARVAPFGVADVDAYLTHCAAAAGGDASRLFAPGTAAALHAYSRGVARVVNHLCDTALRIAAQRGERAIGPAIVAEIAVELFGMTRIDDLEAATGGAAQRAAVTVAESARVGPTGDAATPAARRVAAADEIPVLTESVDFDVGANDPEAPTEEDEDDASDPHTATMTLFQDSALDELGADLMEQIFSGDLIRDARPPPAAEPAADESAAPPRHKGRLAKALRLVKSGA